MQYFLLLNNAFFISNYICLYSEIGKIPLCRFPVAKCLQGHKEYKTKTIFRILLRFMFITVRTKMQKEAFSYLYSRYIRKVHALLLAFSNTAVE